VVAVTGIRAAAAVDTTRAALPGSPCVVGGDDQRTVAVVCDGTASWGEGYEAARLAAREIADALTGGDDVRAAVAAVARRARAEHCQAGEDDPAFSVLVALTEPARARVAWVGDVHALHVRQGRLIARNAPHSLHAQLVGAGRQSWSDAIGARAGAVTVALPGGADWPKDSRLDDLDWRLAPGDRLVLASAQLPRAMGPEQTAAEVSAAATPQEAVARLLALPREREIELAVAVLFVD
jgi:serine/threonine protein phosphatase PrpC